MAAVYICSLCAEQLDSLPDGCLPVHPRRNGDPNGLCPASFTNRYKRVPIDDDSPAVPVGQGRGGSDAVLYSACDQEMVSDLLVARQAMVDFILQHAAMRWGTETHTHPVIVQIDRMLRKCGHVSDRPQDCA